MIIAGGDVEKNVAKYPMAEGQYGRASGISVLLIEGEESDRGTEAAGDREGQLSLVITFVKHKTDNLQIQKLFLKKENKTKLDRAYTSFSSCFGLWTMCKIKNFTVQ